MADAFGIGGGLTLVWAGIQDCLRQLTIGAILPDMAVISSNARPGRIGILVGAGMMVATVVGGILLVIGSVSAIGDQLPDFTAEIDAGTQQSVTIDQAGTWALYGGGAGATSSGGHCMIEPPAGGTVTTDTPNTSMEFTRGSRQWHLLATFTVSVAGTYEFDCTGTGEIDRFAVGEEADIKGFAGSIVVAVVGGIGLAFGFVAGLVILIVGVVRRSSARRNSQAVRYPQPGYPQPGYPQPGSQQPQWRDEQPS
ncbi:MAG: hypothetical protein JXA67_06665 [Micromonosporaceae bacterium]|nr:hypothetical protein [Micromonosporaceae bacterium]